MLFILNSHPFNGYVNIEAMDLISALASLNNEIDICFTDLGYLHLLYTDLEFDNCVKNYVKNITALPILGVKNMYVLQHDVLKYGVQKFSSIIVIEQLEQLLTQHSNVFVF